MKRLCVFCGSSRGRDPAHAHAAAAMGRAIAEAGLGLVYGGGHVGLMGVVADAALLAGGAVTGVIPQALLDRELGHRGLTALHVTPSMHARKALMADLSDGFIALPGGIGTFEELFEIWTWAQLGDHMKPVALLDAGGFYRPLVAFLDGVVDAGFLRREHRDLLIVGDDPAALINAMRRYRPAPGTTWIGSDER